MKVYILTLVCLILILCGCTNCYNHTNSDNRSCTPGSPVRVESKVILPPVPAPTKPKLKLTSSEDSWVLISSTKQVVGSYLVLQ